jgi:hypothetical protein
MVHQEICQQLIDAVNAAISANPEVAAAMKALEVSGLELHSLHITANLRETSPSPLQSDVEFLHTLRIVPDLDIKG